MKHLAKLLNKLAVAAAFTATLASCGRSEYAMLPKTSSYHGQAQRVVAAQPAPAADATPATPEAAPATAAPALATAPVTAPAAAPAPAATPAAPAPAAARKLNPVQRMAVNKILKKADKLASQAQVKKHRDAASADDANALNRYIKLGIIFLLIGLVVGIVFGLLGYILALVGVVFLILGLLEEV
ncbi:hypothetical protein [Hymenobacter sp. B81]|uniref:hypothetical protein n=1 Tax=Hymenobacter sp. B81 TaxID=3344878 RepID=UPI0037DC078B